MSEKAETTKHTPGPWEATEIGVIAPTITSHSNFYVAALIDPDNAEDKANARLIAAEPDLLAACKAALPALREIEADAEATVLAAIARAEGGAE